MLDFLTQIKEEHKDDEAMLITIGEIESEWNAKKYGLVWEQHEEAVDVKMRTHIPVFKEDTDREITAAAGEVGYPYKIDTITRLPLLYLWTMNTVCIMKRVWQKLCKLNKG